MSRWLRILVPALVLSAAASSAHALTLMQTIKFDTIAPFGTFTTGDFVSSGWNIPFAFTQASEIDEIRVSFGSTDADWLDREGPLGGAPMVEVGFLDDVPNRFAIASVSPSSPTIYLGNAQEPYFSMVRSLLLDGEITASLGGFEDHGDHSEDFTFLSSSTLTIEIDGTLVANPVPEPTTLGLLGLGVTVFGFSGLARKMKRSAGRA